MRRAIAITLKIPDNTAYTALVALRRLGVDVAHLERSEIFFFDDGGDLDALSQRILSDERLFNPNKHRIAVLEESAPRAGEVWIEPLASEAPGSSDSERSHRPRAIGWRLTGARGEPVSDAVLGAAIQRLLCNPAIDRAVTRGAMETGTS